MYPYIFSQLLFDIHLSIYVKWLLDSYLFQYGSCKKKVWLKRRRVCFKILDQIRPSKNK